jgi:hypothetical protein
MADWSSRKLKEGNMNIALDASTLQLQRDGLIAVRDGRGARVTCVRGTLWITQDHHSHDSIIGSGESLTIDYPGLTLVTALEPTQLRLTEAREGSGAWFSRILGRLLPRPAGRPAAC